MTMRLRLFWSCTSSRGLCWSIVVMPSVWWKGMVGQRRFSIQVEGQANHAGTTPMDLRKDALVTAAEVVLAIESLAADHPGDPVATVGRLEVWPNAANVVPGAVEMTVDIRDLSPDVLQEMVDGLMAALERISTATGCPIRLDPQFEVEPTPAHALVMEAVAGGNGPRAAECASEPRQS